MKTRSILLADLEIHELVSLTPRYTNLEFNSLRDSIRDNGQQVPIVTYRGKVIDGRHRVKALRELGATHINAVSEDSTLSIDDIENKILNVYENRRHQTPTQKAIIAYRQWLKSQQLDTQLNQGDVAETFGTTRLMLSRAKSFHDLAGDDLLEHLFQGNKINIGTKGKPRNTDSLITLITYFRSRKEEILSISQGSKTSSDDITDEERTMLGEEIERLEMLFGTRLLKQFSSILHARMQDIK